MGCMHSDLDQTASCCSVTQQENNFNNKMTNSKHIVEKECYFQKLGLTTKQMNLLKTSWKAISAEIQTHGIPTFVDIFKSNKEVLSAFSKVNPNIASSGMKCPKDKAINEAFQDHGSKVLARVDEVLHNLDQLSLCVSLIRQTGAYHRRFQGFKPKYFKYFEEPFLGMVKATLGSRYTAQIEVVYQAITNFMIQMLIEGYNGDKTSQE